ncbi:coniferyl aldehyde dehydrogenase [Stenotrophomonas maltophilia]|uniref:coniferyl aldehyde dehydrogenase n=1 Tax=Stenotrophomonas maltophilia TaxID=40324 RepID=UPI0013108CBF|nr:coniferyl aldehyde dehydrogenase [Stenotrophomonas maltophilia]MBA0395578.1 coniferyl aldehyde dehydrogenase [Stenotrophomonas maltophilia]
MIAHTPEKELQQKLDTLRAAFARGAPDLRQRHEALTRLAGAIRRNQALLLQAVDEDFGGRAHAETMLLELFPLHDQINHAKRNLRKWMRRRSVGIPWFLLPSRAFYQYQPLGVAGIIGAWNYPLLLTLGPAVDAIAAGNHILLKPSELAPRTAELIGTILHEVFPPDYADCVTGGPEIASMFSTLPFDHLFFTGSTQVGRLVMQAAARNLTPVTLELGGKSPVILHESYPIERAVGRILTSKLFNAGQTCVAPDYILAPAGREAELEEAIRATVARMYPGLPGNPDYTSIISNRHCARLLELVADAEEKGARIIKLSPDADASGKRQFVAPTLLFEVNDTMKVMQEEIFGPLLPIVTYRTLDDAIAYVNARPHPLALYYFDNDKRRQGHVLANTLSGGVTINDCLYHLAQHNLPFGGVGPSGMGQYHGFDGFVTFSKKRPVMVQRALSGTSLFRAPWTSSAWLLRTALRITSR